MERPRRPGLDIVRADQLPFCGSENGSLISGTSMLNCAYLAHTGVWDDQLAGEGEALGTLTVLGSL